MTTQETLEYQEKNFLTKNELLNLYNTFSRYQDEEYEEGEAPWITTTLEDIEKTIDCN